MASVIGLAPIRPDLKGRLRELLCIHGQKWSPRLVSRQRLLVFSEALICLSYSGNGSPSPSSESEGWSSRRVTLLRLPVMGCSAFELRDVTQKCLPDLDSHQDKRLNRPPCYFHTIWQWRCRQDSHLHRSV